MIKVINFFIPFLMEMLFGKKEDKTANKETKVSSTLKKSFVYIVMMITFSFNYFSINKIYTVSVNYIQLKKQKELSDAKIIILEGNKARADQLEKSLEFCMSNSYQHKKIDKKTTFQVNKTR